MDGYDAYQTYQAVRLHFTSKSFDYFTYHGRSKTSEDAFNMRKDKYTFHKIARMFTAEELPYHFAVNMKQDSRAWIAGMLQEEAIKLFRDWVKWQENRLDNLKRNLEGLCRVNKFEELIVCKDNQFPELLSIVLQGDLEYDVLVILDHYIKFMDGWNKKIEDDFIWSDFYMKFNKYKPFFLHYASLSDPYYKKAIIDGLTLKK